MIQVRRGPWLTEHMPGGVLNRRGETLYTPPCWVPCMLITYKVRSDGKMYTEFESVAYSVRDDAIECDGPPDFYYMDAMLALTALDILPRLMGVDNFRIRNTATGEIITTAALESAVHA